MSIRHFSINERRLILPALVLALMITVGQAVASEFRQSTEIRTTFEVPPADALVLVVKTSNGDVTVAGGNADVVTVDAEIHVNGRKAEVCNELAQKTRQLIEQPARKGSKLLFDPTLPHRLGYGVSISYTLTMPARMGLELETANGELTAANSNSDCSFETTNGNINAHSISGKVTAESVNGSIILTKIRTNSLKAETVNGRIESQCIGAAPETIDISTVNGGIDVTLPKGANAALSVNTVNGNLFISTSRGDITSKNRGSIDMTIGEGKGKYNLSSVNGSVNVVISNPPD